MAQSIKAGGGSLSQNRDRTEERHPNYKGKIVTEIDLPAGSTIWLSGWLRDDPNGGPKWVSLAAQVSGEAQSRSQARRMSSFQPRQEQTISQRAVAQRQAPQQQQPHGGEFGLDDECPF